jgi:hypothetical protein
LATGAIVGIILACLICCCLVVGCFSVVGIKVVSNRENFINFFRDNPLYKSKDSRFDNSLYENQTL